MRAAPKKYNTVYKKKVDVHRDSFLPRRAPKELIQCRGCGAFYHRRRWTLSLPAGFNLPVQPRSIFCPACKKIQASSVSGELHMRGLATSERSDVMRLLRNEEAKARDKNPLERIMRVYSADDDWTVATTTEKLAQRLGRSLRKAHGGRVAYKWSHNNKFVRVVWHARETSGKA
jgi:hypothetical protein